MRVILPSAKPYWEGTADSAERAGETVIIDYDAPSAAPAEADEASTFSEAFGKPFSQSVGEVQQTPASPGWAPASHHE